jgi:alpha-1,2-glucosyltransferase
MAPATADRSPADGLLRTSFSVFHIAAFAIVKSVAPEPYIDETFHYPQCQAYCQRNYMQWDDKITTPPGL